MSQYNDFIAIVKDFPRPGVIYRDITPLMANGKQFALCCKEISAFAKSVGAELIVGPEARGFIFGTPAAVQLGIGFAPVRKVGKLPRETIEINYKLEYAEQTLSIHKDAIKSGQKVVIIDDLLATGGTLKATIDLIHVLGGEVVGAAFLIELMEFNARSKIAGIPILSLIKY